MSDQAVQSIESSFGDESGKPRTLRKRASYRITYEPAFVELPNEIPLKWNSVVAPPGYTYVEPGKPLLTEQCKKLSKERGKTIYFVSQSRRNEGTDLNNSLMRNGFHFDTIVVADACKAFGYQVRRTQADAENHQTHAAQFLHEHSPHGALVSSAPLAGHEAADDRISKALQMVQDMFPKIPSADLCKVVNHAFREGTGRVGDATHIPLPRQVQLAVCSHIRHCHTDYDAIIRKTSREEARKFIKERVLAKIKEWRGEDPGAPILEEVVREVIVLDDEEDDKRDEELSEGRNGEGAQEDDYDDNGSAQSDCSIEILSSRRISTVEGDSFDDGRPPKRLKGDDAHNPIEIS
ncbi:MAG: hypothetical protein M1831_005925 [Alyxoria varia]|nr:MAG: hypothetical protein M1831_005925 [Alyxoria varia]